MRPKVPWTKSMLEKFIEEALLTEDEERIIRTRIAGWSIVKQSMEFGMSTSSISRLVKGIREKYVMLQPQFPDIFPPIKQTKYEEALDSTDLLEDKKCIELMQELEPVCGHNPRELTAEEIIECQKNCTSEHFYK